jgi:hypothetical protein
LRLVPRTLSRIFAAIVLVGGGSYRLPIQQDDASKSHGYQRYGD